jgi:hypothetical protein
MQSGGLGAYGWIVLEATEALVVSLSKKKKRKKDWMGGSLIPCCNPAAPACSAAFIHPNLFKVKAVLLKIDRST